MKKTVRLFAAFILAIFSMNASAQFTNITVDKKPTSMEIVQIDNRENSTLVFIRYTRENDSISWMNINEKTFDIVVSFLISAKLANNYSNYKYLSVFLDIVLKIYTLAN